MGAFFDDALKITVGLLLPILLAILAWYLNERGNRQRAEFERREERYRQLVTALRGFYVATADRQLRQAFLDQVNLSWLYCPDEVIRRAYEFLDVVHADNVGGSEADRQRAAGEFMSAIRRDLLSRDTVTSTHLTGADFKHVGVT